MIRQRSESDEKRTGTKFNRPFELLSSTLVGAAAAREDQQLSQANDLFPYSLVSWLVDRTLYLDINQKNCLDKLYRRT